jgi:hypothetical protein
MKRYLGERVLEELAVVRSREAKGTSDDFKRNSTVSNGMKSYFGERSLEVLAAVRARLEGESAPSDLGFRVRVWGLGLRVEV